MKPWTLGKRQAAATETPSLRFNRITTGVVEKYNKNHTVIINDRGNRFNNAFVLPRGWVTFDEDKPQAAPELPPLKSYVLCLLDDKGTCFVLGGWSLLNEQSYKDLCEEQDTNTVKANYQGKWAKLFKRDTGNLNYTDTGDTKAELNLDKKNKKISITDFNDTKLTSDKDKLELEAIKALKIKSNKELELESADRLGIKATKAATIDGQTVELQGNTNHMITYEQLEIALNLMFNLIKTHIHVTPCPTPAGPVPTPSAPSTSLSSANFDMSASKTQTIKAG